MHRTFFGKWLYMSRRQCDFVNRMPPQFLSSRRGIVYSRIGPSAWGCINQNVPRQGNAPQPVPQLYPPHLAVDWYAVCIWGHLYTSNKMTPASRQKKRYCSENTAFATCKRIWEIKLNNMNWFPSWIPWVYISQRMILEFKNIAFNIRTDLLHE